MLLAGAAARHVFNKRAQSFHFIWQWSSPLYLSEGSKADVWLQSQVWGPTERLQMRETRWCGAARLDLLGFFFLILFLPPAQLANYLPPTVDVKQQEYKEMCIYVWVRCCTCFCVGVSIVSPLLYTLLPLHIKTLAWKRADGTLAQALSTWTQIKWVRKVRLVCCAVCRRHVFVCVRVTAWRRRFDLLQHQQWKSIGLEFVCQVALLRMTRLDTKISAAAENHWLSRH